MDFARFACWGALGLTGCASGAVLTAKASPVPVLVGPVRPAESRPLRRSPVDYVVVKMRVTSGRAEDPGGTVVSETTTPEEASDAQILEATGDCGGCWVEVRGVELDLVNGSNVSLNKLTVDAEVAHVVADAPLGEEDVWDADE